MTQILTSRSSNPVTLEPDLSRELVNHETLWLRNFISKQTQRTYTRVFREFCGFLGGLIPRRPCEPSQRRISSSTGTI